MPKSYVRCILSLFFLTNVQFLFLCVKKAADSPVFVSTLQYIAQMVFPKFLFLLKYYSSVVLSLTGIVS